ncbi:MAG: response regulator [Gammaproteobacteria bacterium]|nr:response regulator [Gammaproteobacteria bacterium]
MSDNRISVLFVEDNHLARKIGVIILEKLGCRVDAVSGGLLAVELANIHLYDIIFMDIGLPDINGLTAIEKIRQEDGLNKNVPIIALTAHSDDGYVLQSQKVGATDFLVKPLSEHLGKQILDKYL